MIRFSTLARPALALMLAASCLASPADAQSRRKQKQQETEKKEDDVKEKMRQEKTFPTKAYWNLTAINDKPVPPGSDIYFTIDDAYRGTGYGGCNTWSATIYPIRGQKLAMGPVAITKKQCDKAVMAREVEVLRALIAQPTWDIEGSDLMVKGKAGSLRFRRGL